MSAKKDPIVVKDYEANTVEEAIKLALTDLGLPKESVKIQILTEGNRGLFGMEGAKQAKIRATILSDKKPKKNL
ncbi:MAG: Jag N-terminal domain-containing protein [Candidatus Omnitrophica bacterium]|nr:Jag N-terminal domain-containing protein [Candidatus Omnitrophota bacterium]